MRLAPCAHIAVALSAGPAAGQGKSRGLAGMFEHHAVLDAEAKQVIHYTSGGDGCSKNRVAVDALSDFERSFGAWRVLVLPASAEHAQQVLERARSKVGEEEYSLVANNCEHFARWCFEGHGSSSQVWSAAANIASSAKGGVVVGVAAGTATTTVTSPWYFMGLIPWGTTTATVPMMSTAAAVGVGVAAFAGWVGLGLGVGYGVHAWAEGWNAALRDCAPICVFNGGEDEVEVRLDNIDSSSALGPAALDDLVHETRAFCGAGHRRLRVGGGMAVELNPPAEADQFLRFTVRVLKQDVEGSAAAAVLGAGRVAAWGFGWREVAQAEARRGDVLVLRAGRLEQVPDPGAAA